MSTNKTKVSRIALRVFASLREEGFPAKPQSSQRCSFTIHYSPFTIHRSLFTIHRSLFTDGPAAPARRRTCFDFTPRHSHRGSRNRQFSSQKWFGNWRKRFGFRSKRCGLRGFWCGPNAEARNSQCLNARCTMHNKKRGSVESKLCILHCELCVAYRAGFRKFTPRGRDA